MHKLFTFLISITFVMTAQAQEKTPTNKHFWHKGTTTASPEKIWAIWTDVPNWKTWDKGLKDAEINGNFTLELVGSLSLEIKKMPVYRQVDIFWSDEVKFLRNSRPYC